VTAVRRRIRLAALLVPLVLAGAVVLVGCSGSDGAAEAAPVVGVTEVSAKDNRFDPAAIQVEAGTTVGWRFEDGPIPHDVTGEGWGSGEPQRSGTFSHRFDQPGTYPYRCTLHDGMDGRVVVTGA
jgi:plastocyanin